MEKELQHKIEWLEKRHKDQEKIVAQLERDRQSDRSSELQTKLKEAKKEKLKLKELVSKFKK